MLWTENLEATIQFYKLYLNLELIEFNTSWGWACMGNGDFEIMFASPNEHTSYDKIVFTGSFYYTTNKVNDWWQKLEKHPNIFYPIENFDHGMREFAIKDNNGYIIQIGQELN